MACNIAFAFVAREWDASAGFSVRMLFASRSYSVNPVESINDIPLLNAWYPSRMPAAYPLSSLSLNTYRSLKIK